MIFVDSLQALIVVGDFLLASKNISGEIREFSVCRVCEVVPPRQLRVTWWYMSEHSFFSGESIEKAPLLDCGVFWKLLNCKIKEVFEVKSSLDFIDKDSIEDIAFVFRADILEHVLVNCAGMRNVFFTRFKYNSVNQLVSVNRDDHLPFSCDFGVSYPNRIWHSILVVKEKLTRLMNHRRQLQQCRRSETIPFSLEAWAYFIKRLSPSALFFIASLKCNLKKCNIVIFPWRQKQHQKRSNLLSL